MGDTESRLFVERLRELQQAAGLSDVQLARAMGWSQTYLSKLKDPNRRVRVSLAFARKAAGVFPALGEFLSPIAPVGDGLSSTLNTTPEEDTLS